MVIIPCSFTKAREARPAAELYQGAFFTAALMAARSEVADDDIFILSAKHGLLALTDVVEPYDVAMGDAGSITDDELALSVIVRGLVDADVYALLPSKYFNKLDRVLRAFDTYATPVYEATAGIGDQKHVCAVLANR